MSYPITVKQKKTGRRLFGNSLWKCFGSVFPNITTLAGYVLLSTQRVSASNQVYSEGSGPICLKSPSSTVWCKIPCNRITWNEFLQRQFWEQVLVRFTQTKNFLKEQPKKWAPESNFVHVYSVVSNKCVFWQLEQLHSACAREIDSLFVHVVDSEIWMVPKFDRRYQDK